MTVCFSPVRFALLVDDRCDHVQHLAVEAALVPGLLRECLRPDAESVDVLAGDAAPTRDALGGLELVGHVDVPRLGPSRAGLVAHIGAERDLAHGLDAARDPGIDGAGGDETGDEVVGLLSRTALAVDGRGAHLPGEAGVQPRGARDVVRLRAGLGDAAADDLFDEGRIDPGALDDSALGGTEDFRSVQAREPSTPLADRGADGLDDDWGAHGGLLSLQFSEL